MKSLQTYLNEVSSSLLFRAAGSAHAKGQEPRAMKFNKEALKRYSEEIEKIIKGSSNSINGSNFIDKLSNVIGSYEATSKFTIKNDKIIVNDNNIKEIVEALISKLGNDADLNFIDVSEVTDMSDLFYGSKFNGNISEWDVSNVKFMSCMFQNSEFNGDISKWDVSNVRDMDMVFYNSKFNGDISKWDVSNVGNMRYMFGKSVFNRDISHWDVHNAVYMSGMFKESNFDGDISKWDVSNVKYMNSMFMGSLFTGDISNWDVSNVEYMKEMFVNSRFDGTNCKDKNGNIIGLTKWNSKNLKDDAENAFVDNDTPEEYWPKIK